MADAQAALLAQIKQAEQELLEAQQRREYALSEVQAMRAA